VLATSAEHASLWDAVGDLVAAGSPLSPALEGRIVCTDSNGATAPNCP